MSDPHVSRRNPDGTRARQGLYLGPLRVTVTRAILFVAVVGSAGYLAYALTVRDATQIPMLASGAAVLGIVFAAVALAGAIETVRARVPIGPPDRWSRPSSAASRGSSPVAASPRPRSWPSSGLPDRRWAAPC